MNGGRQLGIYYLRERNWLDRNGAIIFSQYRTTAEWVLEALCAAFPDEPVALYAGGAASFVQRGTDRRSAAREQIKTSIQQGDRRASGQAYSASCLVDANHHRLHR
jgi:hypothetical protein